MTESSLCVSATTVRTMPARDVARSVVDWTGHLVGFQLDLRGRAVVFGYLLAVVLVVVLVVLAAQLVGWLFEFATIARSAGV